MAMRLFNQCSFVVKVNILAVKGKKMFIDMHLSVHMCVFVYLAMCVKGEFFSLNILIYKIEHFGHLWLTSWFTSPP